MTQTKNLSNVPNDIPPLPGQIHIEEAIIGMALKPIKGMALKDVKGMIECTCKECTAARPMSRADVHKALLEIVKDQKIV